MAQETKEFCSLSELLDALDAENISSYGKTRAINRFLSARAKSTRTPFSGSFELTPLCNLDCKMCYVHLKKDDLPRGSSLLSTDQWISIIDQAVTAGLTTADLTGGECLSYPGFKDIYLHLLSKGVRTSVLTNGVLINEDVIDLFSMYKPQLIQITVYGSNPSAYINVTGHDVFHRVINNIELLKQNNLKLKLTVTPNRFMDTDALQLLKLLRSLNVEYGIGGVMLPARKDTKRNIDDYSAAIDLFVRLHRNEATYRRSFIEASSFHNRVPFIVNIKDTKHNGIPCSSGLSSFHVNWKGELQPCIPFSDITVSIVDFGFQTAWKKINDYMMSYKTPIECLECSMNQYCMTCPAEKTSCILNGPLNTNVCSRLKAYLDNGIIDIIPQHEC